jgi:ubiquinone/menaquinone biosynthesis C-methylase UbiE
MSNSETTKNPIALGKPADYGLEIVNRRFRLTASRVSLENKVIVDFGCGNGAQTSAFMNSGGRILAADVVHNHLQMFAAFLRAQKCTTILPVHYDGAHLPVAAESAEVVLCYDVLEHVQHESMALQEMWRVLKPGGDLVITVPNKAWVFEIHGAYLPLLPWNRVPFFSWLPKSIHRRFAKARIYRRREILKLMRAHSFVIIDAQYLTAPMDSVRSPRLKKLLRTTLFRRDSTRVPFLATSILVHARKAGAPS